MKGLVAMSDHKDGWYTLPTKDVPFTEVIKILDDAQSHGFHFLIENDTLYATDDQLEQDFDAEEITIKFFKTR